jgi:hypothetical protein
MISYGFGDFKLPPLLQQLPLGNGLFIIEASQHSDTPHSVGLLWKSDRPDAETSLPDNTQHPQETDVHDREGIRTRNPSKGKAADPRLRPRSHWAWQWLYIVRKYFILYVLSVLFYPQYSCRYVSLLGLFCVVKFEISN